MIRVSSFLAALLLVVPVVSYSLDRVSVSSGGAANNGDSFSGHISDDGNTIVFFSGSSTLVPGDGNGKTDVFVYRISTNTLTLISRSTTGASANDNSTAPRISGNGRYVVFESLATDLVSGFTDGNGPTNGDIFIHDLNLNTTSVVSLSNTDSPSIQNCVAPTVNTTGRYVAFQAGAGLANDTNFDFPRQIYVRDLQDGSTTLVSVDINGMPGIAESHRPHISSDGNLIVFDTQSDLLDGADNNMDNNMAPIRDVYLRDVSGMNTEIVSVGTAGQLGNDQSWKASISGDGNLVAFISEADNFEPTGAVIGRSKVFLRNRAMATTPTTTRISTSVGGNDPDDNSELPSFSANGNYVVFSSGASDLLTPGTDTNGLFDVYYYDLNSMEFTRISVSDTGVQGNTGSYGGSVSNNGRVVFDTRSTGFDPTDNDSVNDIYATFSKPKSNNGNTALKKALQSKVKKLKKELKALKKSGNTAKAKKFAKKIKTLNKKLKVL